MKNLYNSIFTRKSIRKYSKDPLSNEMPEKINAAIKELTPLDESIRYEIVIRSADRMNGDSKAPQYLCIFSEKKGIYLMNAGYLLQQMNLTFDSMELGACWLGMARPAEDKYNGLDFVICLAFGAPAEPLHRTSVSEFKRNELSAPRGMEELLAPVRLAPSAVNSQPWIFSEDNGRIIVAREKLSIIKQPILGKLNRIDIGIALCHLQLSAEHMGKTVTFDFDEISAPKNSIFMAGATLK